MTWRYARAHLATKIFSSEGVVGIKQKDSVAFPRPWWDANACTPARSFACK